MRHSKVSKNSKKIMDLSMRRSRAISNLSVQQSDDVSQITVSNQRVEDQWYKFIFDDGLFDETKSQISVRPSLMNTNTVVTAEDQRESASFGGCLLYTSPSPRDRTRSRMPSSA